MQFPKARQLNQAHDSEEDRGFDYIGIVFPRLFRISAGVFTKHVVLFDKISPLSWSHSGRYLPKRYRSFSFFVMQEAVENVVCGSGECVYRNKIAIVEPKPDRRFQLNPCGYFFRNAAAHFSESFSFEYLTQKATAPAIKNIPTTAPAAAHPGLSLIPKTGSGDSANWARLSHAPIAPKIPNRKFPNPALREDFKL
jgi:hypothetical protein